VLAAAAAGLRAAPAAAGLSVSPTPGAWREVSRSNLVPAGSRGPNPAFETAFDCAARTLAVEFALALQPERPPSFFQGIAAALDGTPEKAPGCSVSVPPAVAAAAARNTPSRFRQQPPAAFAARVAAGNTFYVNATGGNDGNAGTREAPFATIPAALAAARAAPGWDTIVLREGTHYLSSTVALTAADSGLQVTSAPGEEAWVSGAVPVTAAWAPYNVTPGGPAWVEYDNVNAVYAGPPGPGQPGPGEPCLGQQPDKGACKAACIATPGCTAYTWHDSSTGAYANWCWGVTNGGWAPVAEAGHFSGHLESPPNVYVASLAGFPLVDGAIKGLRWAGARLQRARYPNANSEQGFQSSLQANWTPQQTPRVPDVEVNLPTPVRNTTISMFKTFTAGIGGTCERFSPPAGYWCSTKVQGGGSVIWYAPIAMDTTNATLPHTPYANARGGLIMTWRPGHWASWMAEIGDNTFDATTGTSNFSIARGLFQGSRGEDKGDEIYIENVFEELDAPGEWFFNETTQLLYLWHNASGAPPSDGSISAATVKHLFNVTGTQAAPVTDVSFIGVGFRDTSYTFMDPHGIPR